MEMVVSRVTGVPALPRHSLFLYSIKDLWGRWRRGEREVREGCQPLPRPSWLGPEAPAAQLTVVQQVADHFLAASADRVVQERATPIVPVHEVTPGLVQLLELRVGGRAGLGFLWAALVPVTEMPPNSHRGHRSHTHHSLGATGGLSGGSGETIGFSHPSCPGTLQKH